MAELSLFMENYTTLGLRRECERLGLPADGKKKALAQRLAAKIAEKDGVDEELQHDASGDASNDDSLHNDDAPDADTDSDDCGIVGFGTTTGQDDGEGEDDENPLNSVPAKPRKTKSSPSATGAVKKKPQIVQDDDTDDSEDSDDDDVPSDVAKKSKTKTSNSTTKNSSKSLSEVRIFNFRDVEDTIEKFSGDKNQDVRVWINEFEEVAEMACWTPQQKILICRKMMTGTARNFIFAGKCVSSWTRMKKMLIEEFGEKMNTAEIHRRLVNRTKKKDESYMDYVYEMQRIAKMGDLDEATICEYICDGVPGDAMEKSNLYDTETLKMLKKKLERYEKQREKTHKAKSKAGGDRKGDTKTRGGKDEAVVRCFNCGYKGHKSDECPVKDRGRKCFGCGDFGHNAKDCPKKSDGKKSDGKSTKKKDVSVNTIGKDGDNKFSVTVVVGKKSIPALVDTGSEICVIREDLWELIRPEDATLGITSTRLRGFGGNLEESMGKVELSFSIGCHRYSWKFYVATQKAMKTRLLIGTDFLMTVDHKIDQGHVSIYPFIQSNDDKAEEVINDDDELPDDVLVTEEEDWLLRIEVQSVELDCPSEYRREIENLVASYNPQDPKDVGIETVIRLRDNSPVVRRPRRFAPLEKRCIEEQVREWEKDGIVRQSCGEYASPVTLAKKKDGSYRLCVDYRELNAKVVRDRYPMPLIDDQLDRLVDAKKFTTLDLKNSYFHVPVNEESRKYTAFVTHEGQYEFNKTPFGLCLSPASFGRFISAIFRDLINKGVVLAFVDDLIIPSKDEKGGLDALKVVMDTAEKAGLVFNWKKCHFLKDSVEYLGYQVSAGVIAPSKTKVASVLSFPQPKTAKQVQRFHGMANFFRRFIKDFGRKARPLTKVMRDEKSFMFGAEQIEAFELLKRAISEAPVLKIYDPNAETEVHTDASKDGIAGILFQRCQEDGRMHPCHFYSRTTQGAEVRYHSYELEFLAAWDTITNFRPYLLGIPFTLVTDCEAMKQSMTKREINPRIARWLLDLSEYDYKAEHRPAIRMQHVDALSRCQVMTITSEVRSRMQAAQMKDPFIEAIKAALKAGPHDDFTLEGDILYKMLGDKKLLVVPKAMISEIVRQCHLAGHIGEKKMKAKLTTEYSIPEIDAELKSCVLNCVQCILAVRKSGKQEGELRPIPKGDLPLDTWHIDHLGPLPSTRKSYNYILTIVDAFSKFVWLFPVKGTTTDETLKKLTMLADEWGNPRRLIADRGTAFTSGQFKEYCSTNGIELHHITTGVARGNGQVERIHRIIIPMLTTLALQKPEEWFKYVEKTQRFINSSFQRSVQTTPFQLMTGVKMRCKEDQQLIEILEKEHQLELDEQRNELRQSAKRQIEKIQEENRRGYNLRRRPAQKYTCGDIVAIKRTQFGGGLKVKPKFLGPYRVEEARGNDRYKVKRLAEGDGPEITTTAADFMKPWMASQEDIGQSRSGRVGKIT